MTSQACVLEIEHSGDLRITNEDEDSSFMEKVILFDLERPDIKISMQVYFNEKDQLYFDGYDIGKSVEAAWGDSDYEYTYTIEPEEVNKFYPIFNLKPGDKRELLQEIKNRARDRVHLLVRDRRGGSDLPGAAPSRHFLWLSGCFPRPPGHVGQNFRVRRQRVLALSIASVREKVPLLAGRRGRGIPRAPSQAPQNPAQSTNHATP